MFLFFAMIEKFFFKEITYKVLFTVSFGASLSILYKVKNKTLKKFKNIYVYNYVYTHTENGVFSGFLDEGTGVSYW